MRKVFLDNLPQSKSGYIDWTNSIGKKIEFIYDDVVGLFTITNYMFIDGHGKIMVEYNGKEYKTTPTALKHGKISHILHFNI